MKKFFTILALVLVVAMCASFAVSAADATIEAVSGSNTATGDVELTYSAADPDNETVYSVDVSWTDLAFEYDAGTNKWNPDTHAYDISNEDGDWVDGNNTASVKVDNHSNAKVRVAVTYAKATTNGLAATVTNGTDTLDAATVGSAQSAADTMTATVTASETPTAATAEVVGTITVTITAAN